MKKEFCMFLGLLFTFVVASAQEKVIAFPGADGFGKYTTGGRGGKVLLVDNLNDDGPGSLRQALKKKEPRIIVFAVSGNIELKSPLYISSGNVTIAGQSAPGDGICIKNFPVVIQADNVIIRFLRFRLGDTLKQEADAVSGNKGKSNIIIDHCSMSWATDECASFYKNKNFTLQWCIISESLNHSVHEKGDHGYGGIWGGERASFHHNLIANHTSRLPRFSGSSTTPNGPDELVDFRNNVIYNWANNSTYGGERGKYNMVNNYYKAGPSTNKKKVWILDAWAPYGKFYVHGNILEGYDAVNADNRNGLKNDHADSVLIANEFTSEMDHTESAKDAFESVLKNAGASFRRDRVDQRVVDEVCTGVSTSGKNRNGIIDSQTDVGGWPELRTEPRAKDTDNDGIPDEWETAHGLRPNDPKDACKRSLHKSYDNIEVYLNSLVAKL